MSKLKVLWWGVCIGWYSFNHRLFKKLHSFFEGRANRQLLMMVSYGEKIIGLKVMMEMEGKDEHNEL